MPLRFVRIERTPRKKNSRRANGKTACGRENATRRNHPQGRLILRREKSHERCRKLKSRPGCDNRPNWARYVTEKKGSHECPNERRLQSNQRTNSKTRGVKNRKGKASAGVGAGIAKSRSGIVRKMVTPDSTAQPEYAEGKKRNLKRGGSSICPRFAQTVIEKPGNPEVLRRHFEMCPSGTGAISSPMTKNQRQRRPKERKRGIPAAHHPSRRNSNRGPGKTNKPERSVR